MQVYWKLLGSHRRQTQVDQQDQNQDWKGPEPQRTSVARSSTLLDANGYNAVATLLLTPSVKPPPVVSSLPSGWLLPTGGGATASCWEEPAAAAAEPPGAPEQEALHGGSAEASGSLCCPEDTDGAEDGRISLMWTS
ncbi:hypothetical protein EYF80_028870 [Liparis tanakae]|uniref:Uncharacterized protein n=1 Tax=Liparis tanakae TaxID=230148 RepID=A0A4Z2H6J5_9TELE|nr:hypothetical protein EYF80_028870 [Liparis tanakae]